MTTYHEFTYRDTQRGHGYKTVMVRDLAEDEIFLYGIEVDKEGNDKEPTREHLRRHEAETGRVVRMVEKAIVTSKPREFELDLHYGLLVPKGTATEV